MTEPSARREGSDQPALLDTELAHLPPALKVNGAVAGKAKVHLVVPAEAIEIHGVAGSERGRIASEFDGNVIQARITRCAADGRAAGRPRHPAGSPFRQV